MIDAEKASYPVAWMCRLLGVPRSSFYAWRNQAETASAARRRELALVREGVATTGRAGRGVGVVAAVVPDFCQTSNRYERRWVAVVCSRWPGRVAWAYGATVRNRGFPGNTYGQAVIAHWAASPR